MPLYEYKCGDCGEVSEILVGVASDESEPACASCGSSRLKRMLSVINFSMAGQTHSPHPAGESCSCSSGTEGTCCGGGSCACGAH